MIPGPHDSGFDSERRLVVLREDGADALIVAVGGRIEVAERLEQVHKGLGEMHTLAQGVGDLKHLLTNVKTRGMFGEAQLGALLEQVLAPEQYAAQVATRPNDKNRVDFAIRLPGRSDYFILPDWNVYSFGGRSVTLKNVPSTTMQGMKFPGAPYGLKMACGENPKRVYGSKGSQPSTPEE